MGEQLCHYLCRHICFRVFMICVTSLQYEEEHCAAWAELGGFVVEDLGRQGMRAPGQLRRPEQLFTLNLRYFTELHSGREDHRVAPPSGFPRERAGPRVTFAGPWGHLGVFLWICEQMVLQRVSQSVSLRNKRRSCYKQNGCGCYGLSTAPHISRSRNRKLTHLFSSDYCESKAMTVVWDILLAAASQMQIRASDMWENHLHYILWNAMQVTAIQRNWTAHFAAQCSAHSAQCTTKQCIVLRRSVSRKLEEREKVVPFMPDQLLRDDHDDGDYHHYHYNANRYRQYNITTLYFSADMLALDIMLYVIKLQIKEIIHYQYR